MARILHVHMKDGSIETFGVPDDFVPKAPVYGQEWYELPRRPGETANIVFRVEDVRWMTAFDEVVA
jgi:hypothetical protein